MRVSYKEFLMRYSLRQLLSSLILSAVGALVLLYLLPSFGMTPDEGSAVQTAVVIGLVIFVLQFIQAFFNQLANRTEFRPIPSGPREEGTVKWFNATKGFGFITGEDGEDIFVHYRSIRGRDRYLLREGMMVSYVLGQSGKGPQAEDVDLVED